MNTINERFHYLRTEILKLSQREMAKKLNLKSGSTILRYEKDTFNFNDRIINDISREFNVNKEWLRTGEGDIFIDLNRDEAIAAWAGQLISSGEDNNFAKAFTHALTKLDTNEWQAIESFVNKIIESRNDLNKENEDE